jgi:hypothetical protein
MIEETLHKYSNQRFLGFCCLARNRELEMRDRDKQRCQFFLNALGLSKIFFGIFSLTYLNQNSRPEQDQNYDTNHIVSVQGIILMSTGPLPVQDV